MLFLDFIITVVIVYLVTQILLPTIMPTTFRYNWFFIRKKKNVSDAVDAAHAERIRFQQEMADLRKLAAEEKAKAEENARKANKIK